MYHTPRLIFICFGCIASLSIIHISDITEVAQSLMYGSTIILKYYKHFQDTEHIRENRPQKPYYYFNTGWGLPSFNDSASLGFKVYNCYIRLI